MNGHAILLVWAVLATASSLATCDQFLDVKYLDFSLLPENWRADIEVTKQALVLANDIPIAGHGSPNILRKIRCAFHLSNLVPEMRAVYRDLISLADPNEECTPEVTNRAMQICEILNDPTFQLKEEFGRFLRKYGSSKFGNEILSFQKKLSNGPRISFNAIKDLDQIFAAIFNLNINAPNKGDEKSILQALRSCDLTSSKLNLNPAIRIALNLETWNEEERKDPRLVFYSFLVRKCTEFRKDCEYNINVLTLAATLEFPCHKLPIKIKRMLEYNRLCASLDREEQLVIPHISKLIDWDTFFTEPSH